jgi:hypothetical protein
MRVTTFVGLVALMASVGVCVVQETNRQARARYALGELQKTRERQAARIERLEVRIARLSQTERLERMNQLRSLELVPLRPAPAEARP